MVETVETTLQRYYELADILKERKLSPEEKEELGFIENELMPALKDNYRHMLTPTNSMLFTEYPHSFREAHTADRNPFSFTKSLYELRFVSGNIQPHLEKILEGDEPDVEEAGKLLAHFAAHAELERGKLQDIVQERVLNFGLMRYIPQIFDDMLDEEAEEGDEKKKSDEIMGFIAGCVTKYKGFSKDFEMDFMLTSLIQKLENSRSEEQKIADITKFKDYFMGRLATVDSKKLVMSVKEEIDKYIAEEYVYLENKQRELYTHFVDFVNERAETPMPGIINYAGVAEGIALQNMMTTIRDHGHERPGVVEIGSKLAAEGYRPLNSFAQEYFFKAVVSDPNYHNFVDFVGKVDRTMASYDDEVQEKLKAMHEVPVKGFYAGDKQKGDFVVREDKVIESQAMKEARAEYDAARNRQSEAYNELMEEELGAGWTKNDLMRKYPFMALTLVRKYEGLNERTGINLADIFYIDEARAKELYESHGYREPDQAPGTGVFEALGKLSDRVMGLLGGKTHLDDQDKN